MMALRDSFRRRHALQCGFCTPAMLITARDLIRRGRAGSEGEIRQGLAGNICRCTGYTNIVAAIGDAVAMLAKGIKMPDDAVEWAPRCCAVRTSGTSTAAANLWRTSNCPAKWRWRLCSPHAHARILSILKPPDAAGRIFTAADLPRIQPIRVETPAAGAKSPSWPPLTTDKARYVGEAIAACIAPTRGEAEDLAAAVAVDFEVLDAVVDAPRDMRGSRHPVHESWVTTSMRAGVRGRRHGRRRAAAEITIRREFRMHRQSGAPLKAAPCWPVATIGSI